MHRLSRFIVHALRKNKPKKFQSLKPPKHLRTKKRVLSLQLRLSKKARQMLAKPPKLMSIVMITRARAGDIVS